MLQKFKQDLKSDLIAGLVVIIPLATTIWLTVNVTVWMVQFLTRFPKQLNPFPELNPYLGWLINLGIGFAVPLLSILLIGLMARNFAGRWLLDFGERVVESIPLAGSVYKTLQQLLQTVFQDSKSRFRRVVLVEYPRRGLWAIAFVTGVAVAETSHNKMLSVFIPTTPNPTSGWYSIVSEDDVLNLSISIEDAFKVLLSGGIVGPDLAARIPVNRANRVSPVAPSELPTETSTSNPSPLSQPVSQPVSQPDDLPNAAADAGVHALTDEPV